MSVRCMRHAARTHHKVSRLYAKLLVSHVDDALASDRVPILILLIVNVKRDVARTISSRRTRRAALQFGGCYKPLWADNAQCAVVIFARHKPMISACPSPIPILVKVNEQAFFFRVSARLRSYGCK